MRVHAAILFVSASAACASCDGGSVAPRAGCELAADCADGLVCRAGTCGASADVDAMGSQDTMFGATVGGAPACSGNTECTDDALCVLGRCVVGCGGLSSAGVCDGDVLVFCASAGDADEGVVVVDCGAQGPSDATSTCADIGAGMMGCAVLPGETCLSFDEGVISYCRGDEPACIYDEYTGVGVCVEDVGRCTPGMAPQCTGDVLVEGCGDDGQPVGPSCSAGRGTCKDAACRDLPQGEPCDDFRWYCGEGLQCVAGAPGAFGTCAPACETDGGACP